MESNKRRRVAAQPAKAAAVAPVAPVAAAPTATDLPKELLERIAGFLEPAENANLAGTSKFFRRSTAPVLHTQRVEDHDYLKSLSTRRLSAWFTYVQHRASISDIDKVLQKFRTKIKDIEGNINDYTNELNGTNKQEDYYDMLVTIAKEKVAIAICHYCMYKLKLRRTELPSTGKSPPKSPPNTKNLENALKEAYDATVNASLSETIFITWCMKMILYMHKKAGIETPDVVRQLATKRDVANSATS